MRPCRSLRVILHRERRPVETVQPFDYIVVQADVTYFDPPIRRFRYLVDRSCDCETVIVRGDFDFASAAILHRLIDAATFTSDAIVFIKLKIFFHSNLPYTNLMSHA